MTKKLSKYFLNGAKVKGKLMKHVDLFELLKAHLSSETYEQCTRLYDIYKDAFDNFPASIKWHHTRPGDYARHVHEVIQYVVKLSRDKNDVERLVRLAYIHDIDKLERYQLDQEKPTSK